MCRLMGFTATREQSIADIAGSHFEEFSLLADRHKDGWGISTDALLEKEVTPARQSAEYEKVIHQSESAALLHFRFASTGINIQESNSHPFMRDGISFIHNGTIKPATTVDEFVAPDLLEQMTGTTDSERYFLAIMTALRTHSLSDAVVQTVRKIKATGNFSSLNAMVLSPDLYIVVAEHDNTRIPKDEPMDYYRLSYSEKNDGLVVASSGWDQTGWVEIPNHTMMVVDRSTLQKDFVQI